jgi:hypothetical protein
MLLNPTTAGGQTSRHTAPPLLLQHRPAPTESAIVMRRVLLLITLAVSVMTLASRQTAAQEPQSRPRDATDGRAGSGAIHGRVTAAVDGAPLNRASVTLHGSGVGEHPHVVEIDDAGRTSSPIFQRAEQRGEMPPGLYLAYCLLEWVEDETQRRSALEQMLAKYPSFAPGWFKLSGLTKDSRERLGMLDSGLAASPDRETGGMLKLNKALLLNELGHPRPIRIPTVTTSRPRCQQCPFCGTTAVLRVSVVESGKVWLFCGRCDLRWSYTDRREPEPGRTTAQAERAFVRAMGAAVVFQSC